MNSGITLGFIISCFCFAGVILLSRNNIREPLRRILAIMALVMVGISFVLLLYLVFTGQFV